MIDRSGGFGVQKSKGVVTEGSEGQKTKILGYLRLPIASNKMFKVLWEKHKREYILIEVFLLKVEFLCGAES